MSYNTIFSPRVQVHDILIIKNHGLALIVIKW